MEMLHIAPLTFPTVCAIASQQAFCPCNAIRAAFVVPSSSHLTDGDLKAVIIGDLLQEAIDLAHSSVSGNGGSILIHIKGRELVIECSSRPKKKAAVDHIKRRPSKMQPWDIKRRPTVYHLLLPLLPDWTLVIPIDDSSVVTVASRLPQAPSP